MYQVRFTTQSMTYHKDYDKYEDAKAKAIELLDNSSTLAIGIITPTGIEMIKRG